MRKELQFLIYNTPQKDIKVNVVMRDETIWLTQRAMGELFGTSSDNVSLHLKNIYSDGELVETATTEDFSVVQSEGNREVQRNLKFYNLDAIISVGYRVNLTKATHFRIWATKILKEFIQKGFVLDDERLKQGETVFGKDYFRELLDRVRSIRARLERAVTGYFDYIEDLIERENTFTMEQFAKSVNEFLSFRKYNILENRGKISHTVAVQKAEAEYDAFNAHQKINSDFDKSIKSLQKNGDER